MSYRNEMPLWILLVAMLFTMVPVSLTIVFSVLKLAGEITWSWLWVLSPFWGAIALAMLLVLVAAIGLAILKD